MLRFFFLLAIAASIQVIGKPGFLAYTDFKGKPYKVTYDERSFFLDGKRSIFLAGSVHYPRATPGLFSLFLVTNRDVGHGSRSGCGGWTESDPDLHLLEYT